MEKKYPLKSIHTNKKALFDYEVIESYEAGIVLTGAEVKSVRAGQINLKGSFISLRSGSPTLIKAHISPYKNAQSELAPDRERRILLHAKDIAQLSAKTDTAGLTLIPTEIYLKGSLIKLRVALAKGRKKWDKRELIKGRDEKRHADVELKKRDW